MKNQYPVALIILDGFGYRIQSAYNAVAQADMPWFHSMLAHYPWTTLEASGTAVGLPTNTIGNSEVGHMTIGLGTPIEQPLTRINNALQDGTFFTNPILTHALTTLTQEKKALHIMGLFSDTGVHSTIEHLYGYIKAAEKAGIQHIFIHAFLDGRDTTPHSAGAFLEQLDSYTHMHPHVVLASVIGRSYAMDRDTQWHLTAQAYKLLTQAPTHITTWQEALKTTYAQNITEEFTPPCALRKDGYIKPGDGVIFFNFRPDRARQLTSLFLHDNQTAGTHNINLSFFITPVSYGDQYKTTILFPAQPKPASLIATLDAHGYTTFTIAETTKYAHVTYFFNGGQETQHAHETRVLIPSYAPDKISQHPCMQAPNITQKVIASLQNKPCDFYLINYANADMVGHTGDLELTKKSLTCLDTQLQKLYTQLVIEQQGIMLVTGDHGNAEDMFDEQAQQPRTAHTNNPVYFLEINPHDKNKSEAMTQLKDIAPRIKKLLLQS